MFPAQLSGFNGFKSLDSGNALPSSPASLTLPRPACTESRIRWCRPSKRVEGLGLRDVNRSHRLRPGTPQSHRSRGGTDASGTASKFCTGLRTSAFGASPRSGRAHEKAVRREIGMRSVISPSGRKPSKRKSVQVRRVCIRRASSAHFACHVSQIVFRILVCCV